MKVQTLTSRRARVAGRAKARRVPPAQAPRAAVLEHAKLLREVLGDVDREIVRILAGGGLQVRADQLGEQLELPLDTNARLRRELAELAKKRLDPKALTEALDRIAGRTSAWSKREFSRQVKAALGVDLLATEPALGPVLTTFRRENVSLIKTLVVEKVERVRGILQEAGSSTRVETIAERIQEEVGATPARARLIARDQVLKLNNEVTQERHKAAGVTEYTWSTSRDERVRPDHARLEGTRHKYTEPPVVDRRTGRRGHPGEDYQCRCIADPVIEGFDEPS